MNNEEMCLKTGMAMIKASQLGIRAMTKQIKGFGLSLSQLEVLSVLFHKGTLSQKELTTHLMLSKGGISTLLNKLLELSLVQRISSPQDGRVSMIALTKDGERTAKEFEQAKQAHASGEFESFTPQELETLHLMMKRLQNHYKDVLEGK